MFFDFKNDNDMRVLQGQNPLLQSYAGIDPLALLFHGVTVVVVNSA